MASVNRAILIGNLGKDPEVRYTPSGQPVCNFNIATSEKWTDKSSGQAQERTEWHRIVVWGKQAEPCGKYLQKGRSVYVEGRIQTREWTDKEGVKKYTTEINASTVEFLGGKDGGGPRASGNGAPRASGGEDFGAPPGDFDAGGGGNTAPLSGGGAPKGGADDEDIPF